MKKIFSKPISFFFLLFLCSCTNFLDERSDTSLALPNSVIDLQALLDYEDRMTLGQPAAGDIAADYYFLNDANLNTRNIDARDTYTWQPEARNDQEWLQAYMRIFTANVVLDEIDEAALGSMSEFDRQEVKGRALFYRGWTYFHLAQFYVPYYGVDVEDSEFGLPLRDGADINQPTTRATVSETYRQIIADLSAASLLLPERTSIAVRPSRLAALAVLARLYLIMGEYERALTYTDSCFQIRNDLVDYNLLNANAASPFAVLNADVIYHAVSYGTSGMHSQAIAFVSPELFDRFANDDLRKRLYFRLDNSGFYRFKGSPSGSTASMFAGLAMDEIYLIRAESLSRLGRDVEARNTINDLCVNFYAAGDYVPIEESGSQLLLKIVEEREKQLMFRGGIRWSDLRRFNRSTLTQRHLRRVVEGKVFELKPNDLRYTFLLPLQVITMSGIKQNER